MNKSKEIIVNMDAIQPRAPGQLLSDQPMEALKRDHRYVRQLFDRYLNTQNSEIKREAGPEIIRALELHADLEEAVFYPKVRSIDPGLIDHSEQEHHEARQLMEQIKSIDITHPQCDELFRQLADSVLHHVESEEQQLFPKVQQSGMDLGALGLEMQAYEASVLGAQARSSDQPGMRR
ncbi:hemerythrin domain-containing protein [Oxalobacteraceae bacterium R-40]|uniref:Hemerythrin domain-containing protein n=1 Tax=Keguizhuia sedimenti TaxID=3064264 RepID=A0ABU1BMC7_9BURK|nr:hemerythrin domain-containing protein [Oxalobacteraceae bacterium R-40]